VAQNGVKRKLTAKSNAKKNGLACTLYEKPKNDSRMRLSDDGEIEEVVEDDADYASEQQRRG